MERTKLCVKQISEKMDGKGERIKMTGSMTWRTFMDESTKRKVKEVVSNFIKKI